MWIMTARDNRHNIIPRKDIEPEREWTFYFQLRVNLVWEWDAISYHCLLQIWLIAFILFTSLLQMSSRLDSVGWCRDKSQSWCNCNHYGPAPCIRVKRSIESSHLLSAQSVINHRLIIYRWHFKTTYQLLKIFSNMRVKILTPLWILWSDLRSVVIIMRNASGFCTFGAVRVGTPKPLVRLCNNTVWPNNCLNIKFGG